MYIVPSSVLCLQDIRPDRVCTLRSEPSFKTKVQVREKAVFSPGPAPHQQPTDSITRSVEFDSAGEMGPGKTKRRIQVLLISILESLLPAASLHNRKGKRC